MEKEDILEGIDIDSEIEKRRPKPFRYVSSLEPDEGDEHRCIEDSDISVMTDEVTQSKKLQESFESVVGIGNVAAIETVLQRHELKREKRKKE